jgi:hypothetical protein
MENLPYPVDNPGTARDEAARKVAYQEGATQGSRPGAHSFRAKE